MRVIIDNQQDAIAFSDVVAVVGDNFFGACNSEYRQYGLLDWRRYTCCRACNGAGRSVVYQRQVQGEGTSLSRSAVRLVYVPSMERKWWTLLAVCVAIFMLLLDITIVNVALPAIERSLN